jgi:hypothetical protein
MEWDGNPGSQNHVLGIQSADWEVRSAGAPRYQGVVASWGGGNSVARLAMWPTMGRYAATQSDEVLVQTC